MTFGGIDCAEKIEEKKKLRAALNIAFPKKKKLNFFFFIFDRKRYILFSLFFPNYIVREMRCRNIFYDNIVWFAKLLS